MTPPPNLNTLFNQFNNSPQTNALKDTRNVVKYRCYNLEEVQAMEIPNQKKSSFSLFHINTCSLLKNLEDLEYLLKTTNINFDIIAISETMLLKNTKIVENI